MAGHRCCRKRRLVYQNHVIWSDYLSADDWDTIRRVAPLAGAAAEDVRSDVGVMTRVLAHPAAFESVFGRAGRPCRADGVTLPGLRPHRPPWLGRAAARRPRRRVGRAAPASPRARWGRPARVPWIVVQPVVHDRAPGVVHPRCQRCGVGAHAGGAGGDGGSASSTRSGWPRCSRSCRRTSAPVSIAGSATSPCSSPGCSPTTPRCVAWRRTTRVACCVSAALAANVVAALDRGFYRDRRSARTARSAVVPPGRADSPSADCIDAGGRRGRRALRARPAHPQLSHRPPSVHPPRRMVRRTPYLTRPARPTASCHEPR